MLYNAYDMHDRDAIPWIIKQLNAIHGKGMYVFIVYTIDYQ